MDNKVKCPYCSDEKSIRGEGCCYCDHSGLVQVGDDFMFKTEEEALNHDPEISFIDLEINRKKGRPLNWKPF